MNGAILPAAEPGAHIDIHLPSGIERSYSLNDARERATKLHSRHQAQSRGDSKYFFDAMKVEQTLKISKPRNNFELVESGGHVVLIAGGIGITPADNSSISARLLRPRLSLRISIVVAPNPMLGAFESTTKHLPSDQVDVEYFTPREEKNLAGGFVVQLARSGKEFAVPPARASSRCCAPRVSSCLIPARKAFAVHARRR